MFEAGRLIAAIASVIANLPPSVENLYLDCAVVAKQSATNPYAVHLCPIIRKHATNLKSMFLSCRYLVTPQSNVCGLTGRLIFVVPRPLPPRFNPRLATP